MPPDQGFFYALLSTLHTPTPHPPTHRDTPPAGIQTKQVAIFDWGTFLDNSAEKIRCVIPCSKHCRDGSPPFMERLPQPFVPVRLSRGDAGVPDPRATIHVGVGADIRAGAGAGAVRYDHFDPLPWQRSWSELLGNNATSILGCFDVE